MVGGSLEAYGGRGRCIEVPSKAVVGRERAFSRTVQSLSSAPASVESFSSKSLVRHALSGTLITTCTANASCFHMHTRRKSKKKNESHVR
eukprot:7116348-Pyramimonas_sp.AAC.1